MTRSGGTSGQEKNSTQTLDTFGTFSNGLERSPPTPAPTGNERERDSRLSVQTNAENVDSLLQFNEHRCNNHKLTAHNLDNCFNGKVLYKFCTKQTCARTGQTAVWAMGMA